MRLQLALCAFLLLLIPSLAYADGRAASWLEVYDDDDNLNVISSQFSAQGEATEGVELSASYEVDIISAATADVVTAASPRGYTENRHGLSFAAQWEIEPGTIVGARYLPSWEIDYRSQGMLAEFSREWIDRRLTTSITGRYSLDEVGRSGSGEQAFKDVNTMAIGLGLGWVASRSTLLQASYEPQRHKGYLANPYRFVNVQWDDNTSVSVSEAVPDTRIRHAMAVGIKHAITEEWFLSGNYRFYLDDWGIQSHTGETELQHALEWKEMIVGFTMRGYQQSAADFYSNAYEAMVGTLPQLRTTDKMLTSSWSVLAGTRLELSLGSLSFLKNLRCTLKFEVYDQHFDKFAPLTRRFAKTAAFGASSEL